MLRRLWDWMMTGDIRPVVVTTVGVFSVAAALIGLPVAFVWAAFGFSDPAGDAERAGYNAGKAGVQDCANPFQYDNERKHWLDGWIKAKQEEGK